MPPPTVTWGECLSLFFSYKSAKMVNFRSVRLGLVHLFFSLLIVSYIIGYVVIYEKGYQDAEGAVGDVFVKVKGSGYVSKEDGSLVVWDASDAVWPPAEKGAAFVTTNYVETLGQTRQARPGRDRKTEACSRDADCARGRMTKNGVCTGSCDTRSGFCVIEAWFPLEDDADPENFVHNVGEFTVFVRETVQFPKFGVTTTNVAKGSDPELGVSLFTVSGILAALNLTVEDVRQSGAVIGMRSSWNCDLDRAVESCEPERRLYRLDDPKSNVSKGYNFRREERYWVPQGPGGVEHRMLTKNIGIRLLFAVEGTGGKFSIVPLLTNLGVGIGLLGIATVVADFIALQILSNKQFYNKFKFETVDDPTNEAAVKLIHAPRPTYDSI